MVSPVWQFGKVKASHFATDTPAQQKVILEAMRADWQRHVDRLLAKGSVMRKLRGRSWRKSVSTLFLPSLCLFFYCKINEQ